MINSNAILEVNKLKLIHNLKILSKFASNTIIGATIKANAYGIGDQEVFKILYKNGCRHFFLATFEEAISIRKKFSKGNLYVLNGLENHNFRDFSKYKIIPISWVNRKEGISKFDIKELRAKYLFTLIYCFIEKMLLKK